MVLSYMQEMIFKFFRAMGYTVSHHVMYKLSEEKDTAVKDIDMLAINDAEAVIISCRPYTGPSEAESMSKAAMKDFETAEQSIKDIPNIKGKKIIKLLVVEEPIKKLDSGLKKSGIKVSTLEDLMIDFLILLLKKHRGKRLESRTNDIIRNLIFSITEQRE